MLKYLSLLEIPNLIYEVAAWFNTKWGVPVEAYFECMDSFLKGNTALGWFLCMDEDKIVGGLGVINNDFHDRKDLTPNICALYVEEDYRKQGIAGKLLDMAVADLRRKNISPIYLLTDHTSFYERYGWDFFTMVKSDDGGESRLYIHY